MQMVLLPPMIVNAIVESGIDLAAKERQSLERRLGTHLHSPLRVRTRSSLLLPCVFYFSTLETFNLQFLLQREALITAEGAVDVGVAASGRLMDAQVSSFPAGCCVRAKKQAEKQVNCRLLLHGSLSLKIYLSQNGRGVDVRAGFLHGYVQNDGRVHAAVSGL
jgi:hypothetical protein